MTRSSPDPSIVRLPGVGAQLEVHDVDGKVVRAVRLLDGTVELHPAPGAEPVVLGPAASSSLGAFAAGHFLLTPRLRERIDDVLGGLAFDWVTLPAGAHAVGRTIEELAIRRRTGVTVVAILRGLLPIVDPDPTVRLEAGDELVVACREADLATLERFLVEGTT